MASSVESEAAVDARAPLSRERIIDAAIALMDEAGFEALTMRRLGSTLSVEAMSLYRHFPSKDALLSAVSDHLIALLEDPPEGLDWSDHLERVMQSTYRMVERHPCFVDLLFRVPRPEPSSRGKSDRAVLRAAGFPPDEAEMALQSLIAYTVGSIHRDAKLKLDADDATRARAAAVFLYGLHSLFQGLRDWLARA